MIAFTDYPFTELGDIPYQKAPIREVRVLFYDGDKYCTILVDGQVLDVKAGYLYTARHRAGEGFTLNATALQMLSEYTKAEQNALVDYGTHLGKIIAIKFIEGIKGHDMLYINLDEPVKVRVLPTQVDSVVRECCECIDPIWNVELVDPIDAEHPDLKGVTSLYMYGRSYDVHTGKTVE